MADPGGDILVYEEARSRSVSREVSQNGSNPSSRRSSRNSGSRGSRHTLPYDLLRESADVLKGSPDVVDDDGEDDMDPWSIFSFSLGHFQNDTFSSLWFTYLLLYLEGTLGLPPRLSAIVLLTGQVFDALATPVAGLISDAGSGTVYNTCGSEWHMCPRTRQHLYGTVVATAFFSCVWILPPPPVTLYLSVAYYSLSAGMFNVGWAWVQVNHLSLIPNLTNNDSTRTTLTRRRYGATVLAAITAYLSYLFFLAYYPPSGENAQGKWRMLGLVCVAAGAACNVAFYRGMSRVCRREKMTGEYKDEGGGGDGDGLEEALLPPVGIPPSDSSGSEASMTEAPAPPSPFRWLLHPSFLPTSLLYMTTRLSINITNVYVVFYLRDSLHLPAESLALAPLAMYLVSFCTSSLPLSKMSRFACYFLGLAFVLAACATALLLSTFHPVYTVYLTASLFGVGDTLIMVGGVGSVNDLVGGETDGAAFVYGCMSFTDKLSSGLVVLAVQAGRESVCGDETQEGDDVEEATDACGDFVRQVMVWLPVACGAVAVVAMVWLRCKVKK